MKVCVIWKAVTVCQTFHTPENWEVVGRKFFTVYYRFEVFCIFAISEGNVLLSCLSIYPDFSNFSLAKPLASMHELVESHFYSFRKSMLVLCCFKAIPGKHHNGYTYQCFLCCDCTCTDGGWGRGVWSDCEAQVALLELDRTFTMERKSCFIGCCYLRSW